MLKLFSTENLLSAILGRDGLGGLFPLLISKFGLTDLLGLAVTYLRPIYMAKGRSAVIAMVTVKKESLESWAKATGADPSGVVAAWRKLAEAFADVVASLIPSKG